MFISSRARRSQDQTQQLAEVVAENKRLKLDYDRVKTERDTLRNILQDVLHGQQPATGSGSATAAASNPAMQEAINAVMRQAAGAGAGSPRLVLPPPVLRSPTNMARANANANAHATHRPR